MKKVLTLILATALFVALLSGCNVYLVRQGSSDRSANDYGNDTETYDFDSFPSISRKGPSDEEIEACLQQAEEAFSNGKDYASAIRVITTAQNTLGEDERLTAALEEYQSYIPVYLNELDYIDKEGELFLESAPRDNYGNEYECALFVSNWGDTYVTYYLSGNYTSLSGTCAISEDRKTFDGEMYFEIFGDGVLLYRSNTMVRGDAPYEFTVDISGVSKLTIDYPYEDEIGPSSMAMLCDGLLQK